MDKLPLETAKAAQQVHRAYAAGLLAKAETLAQIKQITGKDFIEPEDSNGITKNTTLLKYIAALKASYKIGLLSNIGNNWICDDFLNSAEQDLFDEMVFSYQVGMNKPDSKIFELTLKKLGVNADEAVMVDDQQGFCAAAQALGMHAVTYKDFLQFKVEIEQILSQE